MVEKRTQRSIRPASIFSHWHGTDGFSWVATDWLLAFSNFIDLATLDRRTWDLIFVIVLSRCLFHYYSLNRSYHLEIVFDK